MKKIWSELAISELKLDMTMSGSSDGQTEQSVIDQYRQGYLTYDPITKTFSTKNPQKQTEVDNANNALAAAAGS